MWTVGTFDRAVVPTDPERRILQVPIPPDSTGRPCYDRELLRPDVRARIKAEHEAKVLANLAERDELLAALIALRKRHQIDDPHHAYLCEFCKQADCAIKNANGEKS